jgi:triosephosphate isomerase (TIM)
MRKPLIAGNWKMNGSLAANAALLRGLESFAGSSAASDVELVLCAPAVYLAQVAAAVQSSPLKLGAQDCSVNTSGAFTGEISGAMLRDVGCSYVIVGHSERRQHHGESSALVAAKAEAALAAGVTPIVCVGETLAQREAQQTEVIITEQISAVLSVLLDKAATIVIAYEPVWAIGTGKTASPAQAQAVHAAIRAQLATAIADAAQNVRILYGGSMKPDNARELLAQADIDGGLIGGASLKAADFLSIADAAGAA